MGQSVVVKKDGTPVYGDRVVDTGGDYLRVEGRDGSVIVPKSDVQRIGGKVEDVKPSK